MSLNLQIIFAILLHKHAKTHTLFSPFLFPSETNVATSSTRPLASDQRLSALLRSQKRWLLFPAVTEDASLV